MQRKSFSAQRLVLCLLLLCFFPLACAKQGRESLATLTAKAQACFDAGDYQNALKTWRVCQEYNEAPPDIHEKIAHCYLKLADMPNAISELRNYLQIYPMRWEAWIDLGQLEILLGHEQHAQDIAQHLLSSIPKDSRAHLLEGDLYVIKRDLPRARTAYEHAWALDATSPHVKMKLAICLLSMNRQDEAEEIYAKIDKQQDKTVALLLQYAHYHTLKNDLNSAEQCLRDALQKEPTALNLKKSLVDFYMGINRFDDALTVLEDIDKNTATGLSFQKLFVEAKIGLQRIDEAAAVLDELLKGHDDDSQLNLLRGKCHLLKKEYSHAVGFFKTVTDQEPDLPIGHYLLALAYLGGGQNNLSRLSLNNALLLDNAFTDAELVLTDIYYKNCDYGLALDYISRICEREPENYRARLLQGNIFLAGKQYTQAQQAFNVAKELNPDDPAPLYFSAITHESVNEHDLAIKNYLDILMSFNYYADVHMRVTRLMLSAGQFEKAHDLAQKKVEDNPQNGYAHHILGEICLEKGDPEAAENHFRAALESNKNIVSAYLKLYELYAGRRESEKKVKVLTDAIDHVPSFINAYVLLANAYVEQNRPETAIETLHNALLKKPNDPRLLNNLAWLYLETNTMMNQAFTMARQAYEISPGDPGVADTLGWAYHKKGLNEQARWYLVQALDKLPDNALVNYHMGIVQYDLNNRDLSVQALEKALALGLMPPWKQDALNLLDSMKYSR